jgi:cell division transport system ATP-binding protein
MTAKPPWQRHMVEFRAVSKLYARRAGGPVVPALSDATFRVEPGELVVLAGPSGAGKSTVLRLASGLERPSAGRLVVDGEDLDTLGRRGLLRLRRRLGIVPQEPGLLDERTAFGNLTLVLRALGASRGEARRRSLRALREVGLAARANAFPGELTASERCRLALARALAGGPRLLLVDEPTTGLDHAAVREVLEVLRAAHARGTTVLVAAGAPGLAGELGARALFLAEGRLRGGTVADGAA